MTVAMPPAVRAAFDAAPPDVLRGMLALRRLIFDVAGETAGVGRVEETLRWGQPAYLTPETKSGTTLRLGIPKAGGFALYVHCQTALIDRFLALSAGRYRTEGTRAVLFRTGDKVDEAPLRMLIADALTYHLKR